MAYRVVGLLDGTISPKSGEKVRYFVLTVPFLLFFLPLKQLPLPKELTRLASLLLQCVESQRQCPGVADCAAAASMLAAEGSLYEAWRIFAVARSCSSKREWAAAAALLERARAVCNSASQLSKSGGSVDMGPGEYGTMVADFV